MQKSMFPILLFFFAQKLLAQVDTIPPVLVCKSGVTVEVGEYCYVTIKPDLLIDNLSDNVTPSDKITVRLRRPCMGTGFPKYDSLDFGGIYEIDQHIIEIWAKDSAGNTSMCTANIEISNPPSNLIFCEQSILLVGAITPQNEAIDLIRFEQKGHNCKGDTIDFIGKRCLLWPDDPAYELFSMTSGFEYTITPVKDTNYLNGVTTYDLTLITKHILGIEALDSPAKIIAADANCDGKVTTFDRVLLQKLILGLITELPCGKSWRFWPRDYVFPNPLNPFEQTFPEHIYVPSDPPQTFMSYFGFRGVKIGDVNLSADPDK